MSKAFESSLDTQNFAIIDGYAKAVSVLSRSHTPLCSISGGSDSDIVLDVIHNVDEKKKVRYFWIDTGLEYRATKEHLDDLELDLLLSAKQEFDLQIAQREELISAEEIILPESPVIATTEDYLADKAQSTELSDLDIAKQHIADYYDREFGELAEFSDLSNISLAYTTDEEHNLPIQVYADLEQYRLIFEYDGNVIRDEQYNSLAEMNENALSVLDFNDLVSLSDDEIASVIPTKASDLPFKVGDDIEFQGKEWHIDSINEDRGRIMLSRDTGNVIMPQEGLETFLSEVVESANHHAGIENLEQMDTTIKEKSAETEISDDAPLFSENAIADAGLGFIADEKEFKPFGNGKKEYEQLTLFGESEPVNSSVSAKTIAPVQYGEPVADVNRFEELHKEIMRGSGFEGGKFRIAEFFQENNPSNQEFADFLKNEYGTGGHTADGNIFSVDHDSKGIHFTLRSVDNGISKETFDFSWTEVAKLTADLIQHDKYITQSDIDRKNQRESKTEKSDIKLENISTPDEKSEQKIKADEKSQNFTITDDNLGEGGAKTKFKNNLLAIQTLKQIESEDRTATPEEQEILSKYVGWGGLAQAFDSENEQWSKEFAQLSNALSPKEYEDARKSVLDSFFTSPAIIDGIYEALDKFGFNGGNLLEPSCGVGNFLGKMPSEMAEHTNIYGVEIDSISGRIAKQLYPDADIQITGFESTHFQNGSFDAAVGNVPFGDLNFPDKQYSTTKLHDFFFAQTLDKVKEGGIVAFVTSKGTLDKKDESFRMQLAQKADLIGAVRLPKADLFDRVNKGEVRVLLGSTGKMGTGTNCQKKLIALHNLDIPWRPSDLQQRIGRIERQGNQNSVAHVFNYVTKGSFDAYLYQTLEAKQRFIGQIMTSKTPARTCEDVDQQALNYSEIKALCTGDERIKEKMMLDNEVKELNLLKAEHTNTVFDMQQTVASTPAKIEKAEERLENLKADRETLRQLPIDEETKLPVFKITIDGTEYTDRKEAAQALEDTVLDFVKKSSDSEKEIGEFQGFKLSVKAVMFGNEPDISITMKGNAEHKCALTSSFSANLKRMESTLYKIDQTINDTQNSINKLKMDLENAMRIVNTPFPQQAELEEKTERLTALTEELNQAAIEAKKNAPEKQRTCYFERAKLKKEAFKDRQKPSKRKEQSKDRNEIE